MRVSTLRGGFFVLMLLAMQLCGGIAGCSCDQRPSAVPGRDAGTTGATGDGSVLPDANVRGRFPGLNREPRITTEPPAIGREGTAYRYAPDVDDLDGDLLTFELIVGPSDLRIATETGAVYWLPGETAAGAHEVSIRVSDESGASAEQAWTITVEPNNVAPKIRSVPQTIAGTSWAYDATASDDDRDPLEWTLVAAPSGMTIDGQGHVRWNAPRAGGSRVVIRVADPSGASDEQEFQVAARVAGDGTPPIATIDSPGVGFATPGLFDVVGTVDDEALAHWALTACAIDDATNCRAIASGSMPVRDGVIATVDPTTLEPREYDLTLVATDASGLASAARRRVTIEVGLQSGTIRIGFIDMVVVSGALDVEIVREYNGSDANEGPLGRGWKLFARVASDDEQPAEEPKVVLPSTPLALDWRVSGGPLSPYVDSDSRPVDFVLPDGREYEVFLSPQLQGPTLGGYLAAEHWVTPVDTAVATSDASGASYDQLIITSDGERLRRFDDSGPLDDYAPAQITLTTEFGERYTYDTASGALLHWLDENGQAHTWTAGGEDALDGFVDVVREGDRIVEIRNREWGDRVSFEYESGDLVHADYIGGDFDEGDEAPEQSFRYGDDHVMDGYDASGESILELVRDEQGRVTRRVDGLGGVTEFVYDDENRTRTVVRPSGAWQRFTYDDRGNVLEATDSMGATTRFEHDAMGRQTAMIDPLGRRTESEYDAQGNVVALRDATGAERTAEYDSEGRMRRVIDGEGHAYEATYQDRAMLLRGPDGQLLARQEHDDNGRLVLQADGRGNESRFGYDASGRAIDIDTPDGHYTNSYDDRGLVQTTINEDTGERFVTETDVLGRTRALEGPNGMRFEYELDARGRPRRGRSPDGREYHFQTDRAGHLRRVTVDGEMISQKQLNADGQVLHQVDAEGNVERFQYDPRGEVIAIERAEGTTQLAVDAAGQTVAMTHPDGTRSEFGYDAAGRVTSTIDALGRRTVVEHDSNGAPTLLRDPAGRVARFAYNGYGQPVGIQPFGQGMTREVRDTRSLEAGPEDAPLVSRTLPTGESWSFQRGANGELDGVVDPLGRLTRYFYTPRRQLSRIELADGRETRFGYTPEGDLETVRLPSGATTSYTYDEYGQTTSLREADGTVVSYERIPDGVRLSLPDGTTRERTYSSQGIVATRSPTIDVQYTYDSIGRLTRAVASDGAEVRYVYAADRGRVVERVLRTPSGRELVTRYEHNGADLTTAIVDPDGGRFEFEYDAADRLVLVTRPNGASTRYGYEGSDGSLATEMVHTDASGVVFARYGFQYDAGLRVVRMERPDGSLSLYGYDEAGRLATERVLGPDGTVVRAETFEYDAGDNLVLRGERTFQYDVDDKMIGGAANGQPFTIEDDGRGNVSRVVGLGRDTSLTFDALNRLVRVEDDEHDVAFGYDAQGDLVRRREDDDVRCLAVRSPITGQVECEMRYDAASGDEVEAYVFGPLGVASGHGPDGPRYVHGGLLNSVVALSDARGSAIEERTYDAFGATDAVSSFPYGYTGAFTEWAFSSELGSLVYLRERWYSPTLGRFLSPDPEDADFERPDTLHRYAYVSQDPLNRVDPSGRMSVAMSLAVGAIHGEFRGLNAAVALCVGNAARKKIIFALARYLVHEFLVQPALDRLQDAVLGWAGLAVPGGPRPSAIVASRLSEYFCGRRRGPDIGGNWRVHLEVVIDDCGEFGPGQPRHDCGSVAGIASGAIAPNTDKAIDIVLDKSIPIEVKFRDKIAGSDQGKRQIIRQCRFAAIHGARVMIAFEFGRDDPGDAQDVARYAEAAKLCWKCFDTEANNMMYAAGQRRLRRCRTRSTGAFLIVVYSNDDKRQRDPGRRNRRDRLHVYYPDPVSLGCGV